MVSTVEDKSKSMLMKRFASYDAFSITTLFLLCTKSALSTVANMTADMYNSMGQYQQWTNEQNTKMCFECTIPF